MYYTHLTFEQRYHIELCRRRDLPVSTIAIKIGVHRSTVYRELRRGCQELGHYHAASADERARARARSSAANHPTKPKQLWDLLGRWIDQQFSPEQAAGRLAQVGISESVSVPAIYAFVQRDGRTQGDLYTQLRRAHKRHACRQFFNAGMPRDRPSIRQRPKHILERLEIGHWEFDTMRGSHQSSKCVLVGVERSSRYVCLSLLPAPTAEITAQTLSATLAPFEVRSITFDNGTEFARYAKACRQLNTQAYFAQPGRPGQRGTCENTIGLIRQYLPKYTSLAKLTQIQLQRIQDKLNHRPRKCLGFLTPHEVLFGLKPTPVALRS